MNSEHHEDGMMPVDSLDEHQTSSESTPWVASPALQQRLLIGTLAVLMGGGLCVVSTVVQLQEGLQRVLMLSDALDLVSWLPLAVVLWVYLSLAREVGSEPLYRGSLGFFFSFLGLDLCFSVLSKRLPPGWDLIWWSVVALSLVVLLLIPKLTSRFFADQAPEPAPEADDFASVDEDYGEPGPPQGGSSRIAVLAVAIIALALFIKLAGNEVFHTLWTLQGVAQTVRTLAQHLGPWALMLLMFLSVLYPIRAGMAKIHLQPKLGGVALQLGMMEILTTLTFTATFMAYSMGFLDVFNPPNGNGGRDIPFLILAAVSMLYDVAWTLMTAYFFWNLRGRRPHDEVW